MASITSNSSRSTSGETEPTSLSYKREILESNNILVADTMIDSEEWSDLAFALGLSAREGQRSDPATLKFAQKMRKRKNHSATQLQDALKPFFESLVATCPDLSLRDKCLYHGDAVPTVEGLRNTIHRLPVPRPTISIGYHREAFSCAQDELQEGIIAGPSGEPYDLKHISQPVHEQYWPFFVVETSEKSLLTARYAAAVSAATCNNSMYLLNGAATTDESSWGRSSTDSSRNSGCTFSLSIHAKVAVLSIHNTRPDSSHFATPIGSYNLDFEQEVASLSSRIHSILVWARYSRLEEISASLDLLDRKVHGGMSAHRSSDDGYDFDPHCLKTLKFQSVKSPKRVKTALRAGLPFWLGKKS